MLRKKKNRIKNYQYDYFISKINCNFAITVLYIGEKTEIREKYLISPIQDQKCELKKKRQSKKRIYMYVELFFFLTFPLL